MLGAGVNIARVVPAEAAVIPNRFSVIFITSESAVCSVVWRPSNFRMACTKVESAVVLP